MVAGAGIRVDEFRFEIAGSLIQKLLTIGTLFSHGSLGWGLLSRSLETENSL
jgi:hypothetical protein